MGYSNRDFYEQIHKRLKKKNLLIICQTMQNAIIIQELTKL